MDELIVYLVSDSTGETVSCVARSALSHFKNLKIIEHSVPFCDTKDKIDSIISAIELQKVKSTLIFYTIANQELLKYLEQKSNEKSILAIAPLAKVIDDLTNYLQLEKDFKVGKQHELGENYFKRVEAINFSLLHDDGQAIQSATKAEIIILGVSRTSKSPTSLYISQKGIKVANIPFVTKDLFPISSSKLANKFVVALTMDPNTLGEIRAKRFLNYNLTNNTPYTDLDAIKLESHEALKFYKQHNFHILDVTKRSVEETAALILQIYDKTKEKYSL